jgi:hypothetical protein
MTVSHEPPSSAVSSLPVYMERFLQEAGFCQKNRMYSTITIRPTRMILIWMTDWQRSPVPQRDQDNSLTLLTMSGPTVPAMQAASGYLHEAMWLDSLDKVYLQLHFYYCPDDLIWSDPIWSDLIQSDPIWSDLIRSAPIGSKQEEAAPYDSFHYLYLILLLCVDDVSQ